MLPADIVLIPIAPPSLGALFDKIAQVFIDMSSLDEIYKLPKAEQDTIVAGPAIAAPNGTVANFIDPPNQNITGEVTTPICIVIVMILVSLRLYSRIFILRVRHLEDRK